MRPSRLLILCLFSLSGCAGYRVTVHNLLDNPSVSIERTHVPDNYYLHRVRGSADVPIRPTATDHTLPSLSGSRLPSAHTGGDKNC